MADVVFIGDEVSAAGYRLAGATVFSPSAHDALDVFERAHGHADVMMITAEIARHIPTPRLDEALAAAAPLVIVVGDVMARTTPPNLEDRVRTILGLDA